HRVPDRAVPQAIQRGREEGTIMTSGKASRLYAFSEVQVTGGGDGLWVSVGMPTTALFRNADQMFARNLMGLAFVTALALCTIWIGSELFINRALQVLLGATERLAKGDLSVRTGLRDRGEFGQLARAFDRMAAANSALISDLQRSHAELARAYEETLEGLVRALDLRDHETEGHSRRVTEMTMRVARRLGMCSRELVHLRRGALLHDIGKIGIPDSILLKPGPLTDEEWAIMRQHPVYAYELLSPITCLSRARDIPGCHHERWDGGGYPQGIRELEIPLAARAFSVVDVYDALRSERPYRPAWPTEEVLEYIRGQAGKQFDPEVVETFFKVLREDGDV
ncbi:MAG: HD-GYP domain-containing protein, partial [Bacillota bacterium]